MFIRTLGAFNVGMLLQNEIYEFYCNPKVSADIYDLVFHDGCIFAY